MRHYIKHLLNYWHRAEEKPPLEDFLFAAIQSKEFAVLYAQQIGVHAPALPDFGLGDKFNQIMRILVMSSNTQNQALIAAMTALGTQVGQSSNTALTAQLATVSSHVDALSTQVTNDESAETATTAIATQTQQALQAFVDAANAAAAANTGS